LLGAKRYRWQMFNNLFFLKQMFDNAWLAYTRLHATDWCRAMQMEDETHPSVAGEREGEFEGEVFPSACFYGRE
jgi:hypothetical protein